MEFREFSQWTSDDESWISSGSISVDFLAFKITTTFVGFLLYNEIVTYFSIGIGYS